MYNLRFIPYVSTILCFLSACTSAPTAGSNTAAITRKMVGVYKVHNPGNRFGCETVVHYFDLSAQEEDSTFLYHAFCHPTNGDPQGTMSALKPRFATGRWSYGRDSLIRLQAENGIVVKLEPLEKERARTYTDAGTLMWPELYFDSSLLED